MQRGRRFDNIPREQKEAEKLYMNGFKIWRIAGEVGVSLMTVYRWAKQYGWKESYKRLYEEESTITMDDDEKLRFLLRRVPKKSKNYQK